MESNDIKIYIKKFYELLITNMEFAKFKMAYLICLYLQFRFSSNSILVKYLLVKDYCLANLTLERHKQLENTFYENFDIIKNIFLNFQNLMRYIKMDLPFLILQF